MNRIGFKPRTNALVWVLACMLLAVGCKKQASRVATSQTIEVTAVKVVPRDVPITFEWLAQTESSRQVEIRARVAGILEKRVYKEGAVVQEGQVMLRLLILRVGSLLKLSLLGWGIRYRGRSLSCMR